MEACTGPRRECGRRCGAREGSVPTGPAPTAMMAAGAAHSSSAAKAARRMCLKERGDAAQTTNKICSRNFRPRNLGLGLGRKVHKCTDPRPAQMSTGGYSPAVSASPPSVPILPPAAPGNLADFALRDYHQVAARRAPTQFREPRRCALCTLCAEKRAPARANSATHSGSTPPGRAPPLPARRSVQGPGRERRTSSAGSSWAGAWQTCRRNVTRSRPATRSPAPLLWCVQS